MYKGVVNRFMFIDLGVLLIILKRPTF